MSDKLQKKTDTQLATAEQVPAYLQTTGRAAQGTEIMDREDYTIPRVALCQSNTPQRKTSDPGFIEGLNEGMFFNTVTSEIYGTSFTSVPLFFFKQRMYFKPMTEGGGIICQSANALNGGRLNPESCATCSHSQFKPNDKDARPDCSLLADYMLLMPGSGPAVLTMKSTGLKASRQLNAHVRLSGLDMFAKHLHVKSVSATKNGNQFYMPVLTWKDFVSEPLYNSAKKYFDELSKSGINVDTRGLDTEVTDVDEREQTTGEPIPF